MAYYDEISPGYDELHGLEQREKALVVKENCSPKGLLLDLGAGTGVTTKLFEGQAECIALDPSFEMVKRFSGLKVVAKAEQLPFKSRCFDSVVSLTALHHADLAKARAEIDRVSKPGACIAVSFFKRAKNFGEAVQLFKGFRKIDAGKDLLFARP
jgi:ubiquinone/menaquinone biosynthesis C-methylase UbiE